MSPYRRRLAAGMCGVCGGRPPETGRGRCRPCLDKASAKNAGHQARLRRERRRQGVCLRCGGARDGVQLNCKPCRAVLAGRQGAYRERLEALGRAPESDAARRRRQLHEEDAPPATDWLKRRW